MMVKRSVLERRRAVRAKRILSIQYRLAKMRSGRVPRHAAWYLSTTHDMSVLGISFYSEVPFHVEDILEVHVIMSGVLDIFKGLAQVVRVEKKETGAFYLIAVKLVKDRSSASRASTSPLKTHRIPKKSGPAS